MGGPFAVADRRLTRTVDMRYHGQNYELAIAMPEDASLTTLAERFAEAHGQRYGFATDEDPVEIVTLRLEANGVVRKAELATHPEASDGDIGVDKLALGEFLKMDPKTEKFIDNAAADIAAAARS